MAMGLRAPFTMVAADDGNFDYNETVVVESSQKSCRDFWIRPTGGVVNQQGPFTFTIDAMADRYLHFNSARLEMKVKVTKADGSNLHVWHDVVAPINLLGVTMWETVEVFVNGKPFTGASSVNAGYKGYLETLLSNEASATNHLTTQFFHMDTHDNYNIMRLDKKFAKEHYVMCISSGDIARPILPADIRREAAEGPENEELARAVFLPTIDTEDDAFKITALDTTEGRRKKALVLRRAVYQQDFRNMCNRIAYAICKPGQTANVGYLDRFTKCSGSTPWDMYSPIQHDFFRLNNHVGPGNKLDIKFSRYPDAFLLGSNNQQEQYRLMIMDMRLHLRTIERKERVHPPLQEGYRMNETQLLKQVVPQNSPNASFRIHHGGVMPKTIVLTMVPTVSADGVYGENPLNLHHYHASNISLQINGEMFPAGGIDYDFKSFNPHVSRGYMWTLENTGERAKTRGNLVDWKTFQAGGFTSAFDLTYDRCNGIHNHDAQYGYIDVNIKFSEPTVEACYILYYMMFTKVLLNDKMGGQMLALDIAAS